MNRASDTIFEIPARVCFGEGRGGLPQVQLRTGAATSTVYLNGAHVCSYRPDGESEILWLSNNARFEPGAAIRGGIPICWPWFAQFGRNAPSTDTPMHGFARNSTFEVIATSADTDCASVVLRRHAPSAPAPWNDGLQLDVEIRLSDTLWMEVRTTNQGDSTVPIGAALHSYFAVSEVGNARIPELTGVEYLDKTRDYARTLQADDLVVAGEIDRIFLFSPEHVTLRDTRAHHRIVIRPWGHTDVVVWNPGPEVAAGMADVTLDGYAQMICIEPANALDNITRLEPGQQHKLGQIIERQ